MLRELLPKDFVLVADLAIQMHEQSKNYPIPFDVTIFMLTLSKCISRKEFQCFVYEVEHKIVGAVIGRINRSDFSSCKVANDIGLFVLPEYRKSKAGIALIKAYKAWAKENADMVCFGVTAGIDNERAEKVLNKQGFQTMGAFLVLRGE